MGPNVPDFSSYCGKGCWCHYCVLKVLPQLLHLAGNLKNCDGSKRATDVGGQHIRKCHRKDESSLSD